MKVHEQLEKLSLQIDEKMNRHPSIVQFEDNLYKKME